IADKRKELLTFQAEFSDITTEINHIQKIKQEVEQLLQEQKGNYKLMAEWKQLSDVMTGKSATKLSLERYVLQMYLQRVLNVANGRDRKSTRLNSSHVSISYAVFCLKKKKKRRGQLGSPIMI